MAPGDDIDVIGGGNAPGAEDPAATFATLGLVIEQVEAPPLVPLTINVQTNPAAATDPDSTEISPWVGTGQVAIDSIVNLNAQRFVSCPEVLEFSNWVGDVEDTGSAATTIEMTEAKTITVVYDDAEGGRQIAQYSVADGREYLDYVTTATDT